jgi:hypothetical protein
MYIKTKTLSNFCSHIKTETITVTGNSNNQTIQLETHQAHTKYNYCLDSTTYRCYSGQNTIKIKGDILTFTGF